MIKKIDLHGLSHEKALVQVEEFLLMNSFSNDLELELITGKSPKLQEKIINQILNKYNFNYYIPHHNTGMMYITDTKIN
jgi:DNA-nicking Smr family endonuclease